MYEINFLAVLLATLASMITGSVWYSMKVFGARWVKLAGIDLEKPGAPMWAPLVVTFVVSFITATVLAIALPYFSLLVNIQPQVDAVVAAIVLWAGLSAARFVTHDAFEGRPGNLTIINIGYELITFIAMALILSFFQMPLVLPV